MKPSKTATQPKTPWLPLFALAAIAGALRCWRIDSQSLFGDEYFAAFTAISHSSLRDFLDFVFHDDPLRGLLYSFCNFSMARLSTSPVMLHLPYILLGTLSVYLIFRLGRRMGGQRLGLIAAGLLAVSPLHIDFSREIGFYSPLLALTLLSIETLLIAVESEGISAFLPFLAVQGVFVHVHLYAHLVMALEFAWVLCFHRKSLLHFLACWAAMELLYLPWHLYLGGKLLHKNGFDSQNIYGWHPMEYGWGMLMAFGGTSAMSQHYQGADWLKNARLILALTHMALFAFGLALLRREQALKRPDWLLAVGWVPAGFLGILSLDRIFNYFFAPRHTLFLLPFYLLIAAKGVEGILALPKGARHLATAALGAIALLIAPIYQADVSFLTSKYRVTQNIIQTLRETVHAEDALVFNNPNSAVMFLYYYDRGAFVHVLLPGAYKGFGQFRLPEDFWAFNGQTRHRVFAIDDPALSVEEEPARWSHSPAISQNGLLFYLPGGTRMTDGEKVPQFFSWMDSQPGGQSRWRMAGRSR